MVFHLDLCLRKDNRESSSGMSEILLSCVSTSSGSSSYKSSKACRLKLCTLSSNGSSSNTYKTTMNRHTLSCTLHTHV